MRSHLNKLYRYSAVHLGLAILFGIAIAGGAALISHPQSIFAQIQVPPTIVAPGLISTLAPDAQNQIAPICPPPPRPLPNQPQPNTLYPCPPYQNNGVVIQTYQVQATITDQVAVTKITLTLNNQETVPAEGSNLFPLPAGSAVTDLTLSIDGVAVQGQVMDVNQARNIYEDSVRRLRDPALLQYVGDQAMQVQIFPIAPGQSRTVTLQYTQLLNADSGLIAYRYPLRPGAFSRSPIQHLSVSVSLTSTNPVGTIYSPDGATLVAQTDPNHAQAGYEQNNVYPTADFQLYYSLTNVTGVELPASVLTYRPDPTQDGYFMVLFTPPLHASAQAIPKDVILVLDQSGSMLGQKWSQAQAAATFVLRHLNPGDRFDALTFSTGYQLLSNTLLSVDKAEQAVGWIQNQQAGGGTDINSALLKGLALGDPNRQTTILFMTDGQPTEGETDLDTILHNIQAQTGPNVRIFNFGVGDDVNTYLLDSLAANEHGITTYVHPNEDLEAAISTLYAKVSSPVLTGVQIAFGSVTVSDQFPINPLPDLYAGQQLIVAGRYNGSGLTTITVNGQRNGQPQSYTLPAIAFPDHSTAQPFVASLWATRKIGYLLQQIRLHGGNDELISEVKDLSLKYGILTPYTAYLVQEPNTSGAPTMVPMIPSSGQGGTSSNNQTQNGQLQPLAAAPSDQTGRDAVNLAQLLNSLAGANAPAQSMQQATPTNIAIAGIPTSTAIPGNPVPESSGVQTQTVDGKSFVLQNGVWMDTAYLIALDAKTTMPAQSITFGSDAYFAFLSAHPELAHALALGTRLIIVVDNTAYTITD